MSLDKVTILPAEKLSDGWIAPEYIPSGKTMPYEFAKETIKDILAYSRRAEYDRLLRLSLLKEAEDNGQITINCKLD